jgi:hypothetical protein
VEITKKRLDLEGETERERERRNENRAAIRGNFIISSHHHSILMSNPYVKCKVFYVMHDVMR